MNVPRTLAACNRSDIPVFRGAHRGLVQPPLDDYFYFGHDGLGDVPVDGEAVDRIRPLQTENGVSALVRMCFEGMEMIEESEGAARNGVKWQIATWQIRIDELKKRGIRAYMTKPFLPENFREVFRVLLGASA